MSIQSIKSNLETIGPYLMLVQAESRIHLAASSDEDLENLLYKTLVGDIQFYTIVTTALDRMIEDTIEEPPQEDEYDANGFLKDILN